MSGTNRVKGITLIETIIAVSILAVGIIGVLQAFPLGVHLAKTAQLSTVAVQLGQSKIEENISRYYSDVSVGNTLENYGQITGFNAFKRLTQINCVRASDLSQVSCGYDPLSDPYPMKKIEVTVSWRSPLGVAEPNINLTTIIVRK